jgi:hypothetical protein
VFVPVGFYQIVLGIILVIPLALMFGDLVSLGVPFLVIIMPCISYVVAVTIIYVWLDN